MRKINRRQDATSARIIAEGIRLYKSLGYEYGAEHLRAQQIPASLAGRVLALGFDRRERERRAQAQDPGER